MASPAALVLDAGDPGAVHDQPSGVRLGDQVQVLPVQDRMKVGPGGRQTPTPVDVAVKGIEALLSVAVDVDGPRMAGLLHSLKEGPEQRAGGRSPLQL